MRATRVGAAVLNQTPLDWDGNRDRVREAIERARQDGVSLLCLPELCLSGYGCEDAFLSPEVLDTCFELLLEIAPESRGMAVSVGLPVAHRHALYNVAAMLVDGEIAGLVAKRFLARSGIHYEPRWFAPWPAGARTTLRRGGLEIPMGDLVFDLDGVRVGFEICEDAWVAGRPGAALADRGVDVILNPSASHFAFGKLEVRKRFVLEASRAYGVTYLYANLLGNEAGRTVYDGGALIASEGRLVAAGPRFGYQDLVVTAANVDLDAPLRERLDTGRGATTPVAEDHGEVRLGFSLPPAAGPPETPPALGPDWERSLRLKEEEFDRVVSLGLFDYLRKCGARGFAISLSGGADSSAVVYLAAAAARRAQAALGPDGLRERLAHLGELPEADDPGALVRRLVLCAYQTAENSSDTTRDSARALADGLGATYHQLDVGPLVASYVALAEAAVGRPLTWETDNVALQNIQARARGPSIWLLANLDGRLKRAQ